jgi:tetratricopeptide (TPR) repeat protein
MRTFWMFLIGAMLFASLTPAQSSPVIASNSDDIMALCNKLEGNRDAVISACTTLIRSPKTVNEEFAVLFELRGHAHFHKGQYSYAIDDFDQALKRNPGYIDALVGRGSAYAAAGDYDRAIRDYSSAIQFNGNDTFDYLIRGNAYRHKGDYSNAIRDYDVAIKLDRTDAYAIYNRGLAKEAKSDRTAEADITLGSRLLVAMAGK